MDSWFLALLSYLDKNMSPPTNTYPWCAHKAARGFVGVVGGMECQGPAQHEAARQWMHVVGSGQSRRRARAKRGGEAEPDAPVRVKTSARGGATAAVPAEAAAGGGRGQRGWRADPARQER